MYIITYIYTSVDIDILYRRNSGRQFLWLKYMLCLEILSCQLVSLKLARNRASGSTSAYAKTNWFSHRTLQGQVPSASSFLWHHRLDKPGIVCWDLAWFHATLPVNFLWEQSRIGRNSSQEPPQQTLCIDTCINEAMRRLSQLTISRNPGMNAQKKTVFVSNSYTGGCNLGFLLFNPWIKTLILHVCQSWLTAINRVWRGTRCSTGQCNTTPTLGSIRFKRAMWQSYYIEIESS